MEHFKQYVEKAGQGQILIAQTILFCAVFIVSYNFPYISENKCSVVKYGVEKQLKVEHNIRLSEMDKSIAATLGLRYVSDTDRSSVAGLQYSRSVLGYRLFVLSPSCF